MDDASFKRILTAFADTPADLDLSKGQLLVQVRDELIEAKVSRRGGALVVEHEDTVWPAERWLVARIARLPLLADRLLSHLPAVPHFITPSASFLDDIERAPEEVASHVPDALSFLMERLAVQPAGSSSVLYLTCDAGEGKTSLINELARAQAARYRAKEADWLVVPVSLGGRPFLRFDDVVAGALVNRLRFPLLYFDAFVELVRLGVVVPALDGFEEMFVEGTAGDAVSALGNLMQTLQSSGSVLVAARKAYFEYKSLETQAKLFDALGTQSVAFAQMSLLRWDRPQFLAYATKRGLANGPAVYDAVAGSLGETHPLVTRAVLVRRLLDVASEAVDLALLLPEVRRQPDQYFSQFVGAILSREAREKWIDRSGDPATPLLTADEHEVLLSAVANEMWLNQSTSVGADLLELAAELFCDSQGKSLQCKRQVMERIKTHALITQGRDSRSAFAFDHEEFYQYFLGRSLAKSLVAASIAEVRYSLGRGVLPRIAVDTVASALVQTDPVSQTKVVRSLGDTCQGEPSSSFVRENAGAVAVRVIDRGRLEGVTLRHMVLPAGALEGRRLNKVEFESCYVFRTSLAGTQLAGSSFQDCTIEGIELPEGAPLQGVRFSGTTVGVVVTAHSDQAVYDPGQVATLLRWAGATVPETEHAAEVPRVVVEDKLALVERVCRRFLRATQINENTLRQNLGVRARDFMEEVLPDLLRARVLEEIEYHGKGRQRRFRMGLPLRVVERLLVEAQGTYGSFLERAAAQR